MLTCFTLSNAIKGLMIMASEIFNEEIDLKTLLLSIDNNIIEEFNGY